MEDEARLSTRIFEEMKIAEGKLTSNEAPLVSPHRTFNTANQEELVQNQRDLQYMPICA